MKIRHAAIFLALPLLCTTAQANSFLHYAGEFNFRTGENRTMLQSRGYQPSHLMQKNIFYAINDSRNNNKEGDASLYTLKYRYHPGALSK